ncbi:MAG: NADH-quinone oxidoreductase subunit 5 family protein [Candidatus Odinarchaeia archaeon]
MLPFAPWLWSFPMIGAVLIPIVYSINKKAADYFAVIISGITMIFAISMIPDIITGYDWLTGIPLQDFPIVGANGDWQVPWIAIPGVEMGVLVDPLSVFMANIASDIGFLIVVFSLGYMKHDPDKIRYWFFILFFLGGMNMLVLADNLLMTFIGWEIVGLCSYALIGFWYKKKSPSPDPRYNSEGEYNAAAGMKAFITTRVGDVCLLISIIIIFTFAGTFNYHELVEGGFAWVVALSNAGILLATLILFFGGPVGKSAQFPLHVWLPEAMAGPTTVSALIHAAAMVKAGVFLVARMLPIFHEAYLATGYAEFYTFFQIVAWVGIFTAFFSATIALTKTEIKQVLAYSTISQLGYMFAALGLGGTLAEIPTGYVAAVFLLAAHAIFKALLFLGAGSVLHATETKDMFEMGGIRKDMPITYATMVVGVASLSGIPFLFAGGWAKEAVLITALEAGNIPIFIVGTITAALTVFYSFRMLGLTFFGEKSEHLKKLEAEGHSVHESEKSMTIPLLILAAGTIIVGVWSIPDFFGIPGWETGMYHFFESIIGAPAHHVVPATDPIVLSVLGISIAMIVVGIVPAYMLYIRRDGKKGVKTIKPVYIFLKERWFINHFYYGVFVDGLIRFSRGAYKYIDKNGIDKFNDVLVNGTVGFTKRFRKTHTGILNVNMLGIMIGIVVMVAALMALLLI